MNAFDRGLGRICIALGVLQLFIGIMGVAGGIPMILNPAQPATGFKTETLAQSPFQDYLVPGIVLLTVNGLGNLVAAIASFRRQRPAGELGLAFGAFLLAWVAAQVWWIGLVNWMQPFFFALAIAEVYLGFAVRQALQAKAQPSEVP